MEVQVRVPGDYPVVATAVNQTFDPYHFFGVLSTDYVHITEGPLARRYSSRRVGQASVQDPVEAADSGGGLFAEMASEVKDLSGLTDRQLGQVFPVSREQFQRWRTGREDHPSEAHIRRMAALRELLQDAGSRVDSIREWLLIPQAGINPYDLLCQARFEEVWMLLTELPSRLRSRVQLGQDGAWEQLPRAAVRGTSEPDRSPPIPIDDDDDDDDDDDE
ncbi:MAG: hypothetical protein ACLP01_17275 [Solirubrobacteraceae bacterium]